MTYSVSFLQLIGGGIAICLLIPKLPLWSGVLITAADVFKTLTANAALSRKIAAVVLEELHEAAREGGILTEEVGSMKFSILPRPQDANPEDIKKLNYILPEYFS